MQEHRSAGHTDCWRDVEKAHLSHHHQRRWLWQRQAHNLPRSARYLVCGLVALCAVFGFMRGYSDFRDQALKQYPTDYHKLYIGRPHISKPSHPVRFSEHTSPSAAWTAPTTATADSGAKESLGGKIDERYLYVKGLGSGQEGKADLYIDQQDGSTVVVKIFSSIARNWLPTSISRGYANYTTTWPAEIEASLLLGSHDGSSGYVSVMDYFILQTPSGWSWALVTPFMARGTLAQLAADEHDSSIRDTTDELDATYRHNFEAMLSQLRTLHRAGYCHDDVKPDNIFIQDPEHWLLGDLGNVRHVEHPWHGTKSWTRQNQYVLSAYPSTALQAKHKLTQVIRWPDCTSNDLRRAYKSYLWFLRAASVDKARFDRDFWQETKDWSRMYWDFMQSWMASSSRNGAANV